MKNADQYHHQPFAENTLKSFYGASSVPDRTFLKIAGDPDRTMEKILAIPGMELISKTFGDCEENVCNFPNGEQTRLECVLNSDTRYAIGYTSRKQITYKAGDDTFNLINRRLFFFKEVDTSLEDYQKLLPGVWQSKIGRNMPHYLIKYQDRLMMVVVYPDDCALFMFDWDLDHDAMIKTLLAPLTKQPELLHEVKSPEETSALKKLLTDSFGPSALPSRNLGKVDGDPTEVTAKIMAIPDFEHAETLVSHCGKYVWNTDDGEQPRLVCDLNNGENYIIGLGIREDLDGLVKRRVMYLKKVTESPAYFDALFGKEHSFNEYEKLQVHRMKFKDVDFYVHEMADCDLIITGFWEDEIMAEINKVFVA